MGARQPVADGIHGGAVDLDSTNFLSFAKNASVPKTVIFYWFWRLGSGIQRLNLWHVTLLRASSAELDAPLNPIWVYSLKR
jgi:hypothetical protein